MQKFIITTLLSDINMSNGVFDGVYVCQNRVRWGLRLK